MMLLISFWINFGTYCGEKFWVPGRTLLFNICPFTAGQNIQIQTQEFWCTCTGKLVVFMVFHLGKETKFNISDIGDQLMDYVFNMEIPLVISQFCLCLKLHLNCRDGVFIVFLCILPITKYNIIFCKPSAHFYHSVNQCFDRILQCSKYKLHNIPK